MKQKYIAQKQTENEKGDKIYLFYFVTEGEDGFAFADRLLHERGVFLTPGGVFGSAGQNYVRLSLCAPVEVLEEVLKIVKQ